MPVFGCTPNIEELDLHGCNNLEHLPDVSKNLQLLDLKNCSKLQRFPSTPGEMKFLREVYLQGTPIEELPAFIKDLVSLEEIDLTDCKKLSILPSSIYRLQNLEVLRLSGCSKLIKFPKKEEDSSDPYTKTGFRKLRTLDLEECNLLEVEFLENHSCFPSLEKLYLPGNNFTNLPTCEQLHELHTLVVRNCKRLQEIGNIPGQLGALWAQGCESLSKIPSGICDVTQISLYSCHELVRNVLTIHDLFNVERFCPKSLSPDLTAILRLPGGEMPEWLVPNNEGYISFMASKVLFEKFLGLAICVVLKVKERPEGTELLCIPSVNGNSMCGMASFFDSGSDHVWLHRFNPWKWRERDALSPNEWSHFQCIFRASHGAIVKKCGFRLLFRPLENDLKVLLQHNPLLLDPALLYEVQHDHSQTSTVQESSNATEDLPEYKTSTEEESSSNLVLNESNMANFSLRRLAHEDNQTNTEDGNSNETENLQGNQTSTAEDSSINLVCRGLDMANFSIEKYRYSLIRPKYRNVVPRREMPKEFILVEDDTISFMASEDLYDNILGLTLCVVLDVEDGKRGISFDIVPHVNGKRRNVLSGSLVSFDSDHMWIKYLGSNVLWGLLEGGVDFEQFDERYLRFSLRLEISGGTVKKLGYVIRCRKLEDDLKVELEGNQLVNLASLYEDSHAPADPVVDIHFGHHLPREYLRRFHMHREPNDCETDQTGSGECSSETD